MYHNHVTLTLHKADLHMLQHSSCYACPCRVPHTWKSLCHKVSHFIILCHNTFVDWHHSPKNLWQM